MATGEKAWMPLMIHEKVRPARGLAMAPLVRIPFWGKDRIGVED